MLQWLAVNAGTLAVGLVLAAVAAAAVYSVYKDKKQGKGGCGGNCAGCPMGGNCSSREK